MPLIAITTEERAGLTRASVVSGELSDAFQEVSGGVTLDTTGRSRAILSRWQRAEEGYVYNTKEKDPPFLTRTPLKKIEPPREKSETVLFPLIQRELDRLTATGIFSGMTRPDTVRARYNQLVDTQQSVRFWDKDGDLQTDTDRLLMTPERYFNIETELKQASQTEKVIKTPYGDLPLATDSAAGLGLRVFKPILSRDVEGDSPALPWFIRDPMFNTDEERSLDYAELSLFSFASQDTASSSNQPMMGNIQMTYFPQQKGPSFEAKGWRLPSKDAFNAYRSQHTKAVIQVMYDKDGNAIPLQVETPWRKCGAADREAAQIEPLMNDTLAVGLAVHLGIPNMSRKDRSICVDEPRELEMDTQDSGERPFRLRYPKVDLLTQTRQLRELLNTNADQVNIQLAPDLVVPRAELEAALQSLEDIALGKRSLSDYLASILKNPWALAIFAILAPLGTGLAFSITMGYVPSTHMGARWAARAEFLKEDYRLRLSSHKNFLDHYSMNLTELARRDKLSRMVGREDVLESVLTALTKMKSANALLVGPAGSGKTTIMEALAYAYLDDPKVEVRLLDLPGMIAGTQYRGMAEERFKGVIDEILRKAEAGDNEAKAELTTFQSRVSDLKARLQKRAEREGKTIILCIDEIHMLMGAGGSEGGMDGANIMKPSMAAGTLHVVGATTNAEKAKYLDRDPAMLRRFAVVPVLAPNQDEALQFLRGKKAEYEAFHKVTYSDDVLVKARDWTWGDETRGQPAAAFDAIDLSGSRVKRAFKQGKRDNNQVALADLRAALQGIGISVDRDHLPPGGSSGAAPDGPMSIGGGISSLSSDTSSVVWTVDAKRTLATPEKHLGSMHRIFQRLGGVSARVSTRVMERAAFIQEVLGEFHLAPRGFALGAGLVAGGLLYLSQRSLVQSTFASPASPDLFT